MDTFINTKGTALVRFCGWAQYNEECMAPFLSTLRRPRKDREMKSTCPYFVFPNTPMHLSVQFNKHLSRFYTLTVKYWNYRAQDLLGEQWFRRSL